MKSILRRIALAGFGDPPKRWVYLLMLVVSPALVIGALWTQGNLTIVTSSITLSVFAFSYFNLEKVQNYLRPFWREDYEARRAELIRELSANNVRFCKREKLLSKLSELENRHHLVKSPRVTYRQVIRMAVLMGILSRLMRMSSTH